MNDNTEISQKNFIYMVTVFEGSLLLLSLIWGYFAEINPFGHIYLNHTDIALAILASIVFVFLNFIAINKFSEYISFFRRLKDGYEEITGIAANITIPGALLIAAISGFSEEIFFRGILQQQFGIIIASVVFGLLHIGSARTVNYGIYAITGGFYFGLLYLVSGNLLVPIIAHILNNFMALPYMKYYYRKYVTRNTA